MVAIGLAAIVFILETIPSIATHASHWLTLALNILYCFFLLEYLARIWVARQRLSFIFSFWGLVDLIAILPLILSIFGLSLDLVMVRILRLLRLFSMLKIGRYSKTIESFVLAFGLAKEQLALTLCAAMLVIFVASAGIYQFEHEAQPSVFTTFFDALWWSIATLTTVGYGDIYPITNGGKAFTTIVLFAGLGVVALPAGIIAAALANTNDKK